ncbi:MAG TPA: ATP synthase F0 subunit B [Thermoanaerobaculia bacterium]|nr:ATP synthase F0 subunit B [Thermoanaerobaculia bacterium]
MRRLVLILLLLIVPAAYAQHPSSDTPNDVAHGSEKDAHERAHPSEEHGAPKTYFGIPGWILKLANMLLFIGVLVWLAGGPVKKAFAERSAAIRRAADEARERREKADRMANDIQARLAQVEQEIAAIHERAVAEGERQKRELIVAAEAEAQKILASARNEVDNRLKFARRELTEYAGQLATERAEAILREKINDNDQRKLFEESLRELEEVRA